MLARSGGDSSCCAVMDVRDGSSGFGLWVMKGETTAVLVADGAVNGSSQWWSKGETVMNGTVGCG